MNNRISEDKMFAWDYLLSEMAMVKVELEDRVVFVNEKALKRTQVGRYM